MDDRRRASPLVFSGFLPGDLENLGRVFLDSKPKRVMNRIPFPWEDFRDNPLPVCPGAGFQLNSPEAKGNPSLAPALKILRAKV